MQGKEAAVLAPDSDAGDSILFGLRGANVIDPSLGDGEDAMCKAKGIIVPLDGPAANAARDFVSATGRARACADLVQMPVCRRGGEGHL